MIFAKGSIDNKVKLRKKKKTKLLYAVEAKCFLNAFGFQLHNLSTLYSKCYADGIMIVICPYRMHLHNPIIHSKQNQLKMVIFDRIKMIIIAQRERRL